MYATGLLYKEPPLQEASSISQALDNSPENNTLYPLSITLHFLLLWHTFCLKASFPYSPVFPSSNYYDGQTVQILTVFLSVDTETKNLLLI